MTVGYGNHEAPGAGQAPKSGEAADAKTGAAKPGDAAAGSRQQDDGSGDGLGQHDTGSPAANAANTDEIRAPGSGAFPTNPQGDEADPGSD